MEKLIVYLDWNSFNYYKNPRKKYIDNDTIFKSLIDENKNKFNILYSPAHLYDLKKGWNKTGSSKKNTYDDLRLLNEITNSTCIVQYFGFEKVVIQKRDAIDFFSSLISDEQDMDHFLLNEDIISFIDNLPSSDEKSNIEKAIKDLEDINLEISDFKSADIDNDYFLGYLKQINNENDPKRIFDLTTKYFYDLNENPDVYKELRKQLESIINKKNDEIINDEEIISYYDELLKTCIFKTTFETLINMNSKHQDGRPLTSNPLYDKFYLAYMTLDILGLEKEKITKKNYFPNLSNDALHFFYGAYADLFISEDKGIKRKSKILYNYFNINTKIFAIKDFNIYCYK